MRHASEARAGRQERVHRTHVRGADSLVQCRLADPVLHAQDRSHPTSPPHLLLLRPDG
jgi:hypothetical protein